MSQAKNYDYPTSIAYWSLIKLSSAEAVSFRLQKTYEDLDILTLELVSQDLLDRVELWTKKYLAANIPDLTNVRLTTSIANSLKGHLRELVEIYVDVIRESAQIPPKS